MIDVELSTTLLAGLATVVYVFVVAVTTSVRPIRLAVGAVGVIPALCWMILPDFFESTAVELSLSLRRPALILIALAIVLRYVPVRSRRVGVRGLQTAAIVAAALFWLGLGLSTANLLVAGAAVLAAFASGSSSTPRVESFAGESQSPPRRPPDDE